MFMPNPMILTIKLFYLNPQKHFFYRSPSVNRKTERCCSILDRFQKKFHFCYQNNILHKTRGSFDESENVTLYSLLLDAESEKIEVMVPVTVHHKDNSQLINETTASASEGQGEMEDSESGEKSLLEEVSHTVSEGFWTVFGGGGKRKAKNSSDEDNDSIKVATGGLVNSFFSTTNSQRSKKQKDYGSKEESRNEKDEGMGQTLPPA